MPVVIDDVVQHLHNQGIGVRGTNLFRGYLPESPAACIAVLDTGGLAVGTDVEIHEPTFQVFVRSTTYSLGRAKLDSIRAALHNQKNTRLVPNGVYFYTIFAITEGGHVGRDDNGNDMFSINFQCKTR